MCGCKILVEWSALLKVFMMCSDVVEKPVIVERPQDVTVSEHSVVRLRCRATGDPEPVIVWTKRDGQIPAERSETIRFFTDVFFTSAKEVMFLPDFVCLSVCLFVSVLAR